jgi:hypothetical protein
LYEPVLEAELPSPATAFGTMVSTLHELSVEIMDQGFKKVMIMLMLLLMKSLTSYIGGCGLR